LGVAYRLGRVTRGRWVTNTSGVDRCSSGSWSCTGCCCCCYWWWGCRSQRGVALGRGSVAAWGICIRVRAGSRSCIACAARGCWVVGGSSRGSIAASAADRQLQIIPEGKREVCLAMLHVVLKDSEQGSCRPFEPRGCARAIF
jgi:hypothetical protein